MRVSSTSFARMLRKFCQQRASLILPPHDAARLLAYMLRLLASAEGAPTHAGAYDWQLISQASGIDILALRRGGKTLAPAFDALEREVSRKPKRRAATRRPNGPKSGLDDWKVLDQKLEPTSSKWGLPDEPRHMARRGPSRKPVVDYPKPENDTWVETPCFASALDMHMRRHRDTSKHLARALETVASTVDATTLSMWRRGAKVPRASRSLAALEAIEQRYRLPSGYFIQKIPVGDRCASPGEIPGIGPAERRRLAWHLPSDFDRRPLKEREEIIEWVQTVIISGSTEYRRFQAAAMKQRYAVRFPGLLGESTRPRGHYRFCRDDDGSLPDPELSVTAVDAPPMLADEMSELVRFKTATLTAFGYQRNGVWGEETASQKVEHLGLMFGALAAAPSGAVHGFGVPSESLTFGLLAFPIVWDWYIQWRERRRGFYTAWEVDMLRTAVALTRADTGWMRQTPHLAERIRPIPNLISEKDIEAVRANWEGACELVHRHGLARAKEVQRVARVHRDPFEPIMTVLESDSPLGEYRKITEEILRLMPDEGRYPRAAAEAVRAFLMLRFGLHLGLRQKNLRSSFCAPAVGYQPRSGAWRN